MDNVPEHLNHHSEEEEREVLQEIEHQLENLNPKIFQGIKKDKKREIVTTITSVMMIQKSHSGPLPDPETLAGYDHLIPEGADRIMKMAENQQEHRMKIEKKAIGRNSFQSQLGQVFAFIITVLGFGCGTWLIYHDKQIAGSILFGSTLASIVYAFLKKDKD